MQEDTTSQSMLTMRAPDACYVPLVLTESGTDELGYAQAV